MWLNHKDITKMHLDEKEIGLCNNLLNGKITHNMP